MDPGVGPTPRGRDAAGPVVDLRSDAVTRPTAAMWHAMRTDPLDWSRLGDRTVSRLERQVAELVDKPAALFVPSGTMGNTLALLCWSSPGQAFVADRHAHVLRSEDDAYARLAGLAAAGVHGDRGHPTPDQVATALADDPAPALLWLENTHTFAGGTVATVDETAAVAGVAHAAGVAVHLDGARLWNAAVATGGSVADLARHVDTVTVNLNKGLACPAGALLCGPREVIDTARQRALGLGGLVSQAGMLAACGVVAVADPTGPLRRDHELAAELADRLRAVGVDADVPETNIVLATCRDAAAAVARLAAAGVLGMTRDASTLRLVTHRDVGEADIARAVAATAHAVDC